MICDIIRSEIGNTNNGPHFHYGLMGAISPTRSPNISLLIIKYDAGDHFCAVIALWLNVKNYSIVEEMNMFGVLESISVGLGRV